MKQRTIINTVKAQGVGLHSGDIVHMTLRPAPEHTGVVFRRIDQQPPVEILAHSAQVCDTRMSTTLGSGEVRVATVEHLLSALAGLMIDNIYVDLNAAEVPILDGSAHQFVFLLQSAGVKPQSERKRFIRILKPVCVEDGDKWARFDPFDGFRIGFTVAFDHQSVAHKHDRAELHFSSNRYIREISRARTFGFKRDIEWLRENQLAMGGSLDNAIIVDEDGVVNEDGLRSRDELVKHKMLDAIGDVYLLGHALVGSYDGHKSGHALNHKLLTRLLEQDDAWELVDYDTETLPESYRLERAA